MKYLFKLIQNFIFKDLYTTLAICILGIGSLSFFIIEGKQGWMGGSYFDYLSFVGILVILCLLCDKLKIKRKDDD